MRTVLGLLCICFVFNVVHGRSGGAPNSACAGVSPDAGLHGAAAQTSSSPFTLTIQGNPTEYIPGQQYTLTFSRGGNNFRGYLAVSLNMNGNRVGSFTAGTNQRTTCSDSRGITHTNGNDKTSVTLTWTAPAAGTGSVTFRYAGVVVQAMYWANQVGPMLNEGTVATTTTVEASSTSTSTALSVAVSSPEVGTSTSSPTPSATTSTATDEATSVAMTMVMATPMPTSTASTEGTTSHGSTTVAGILMTMGILVIGLVAIIM